MLAHIFLNMTCFPNLGSDEMDFDFSFKGEQINKFLSGKLRNICVLNGFQSSFLVTYFTED